MEGTLERKHVLQAGGRKVQTWLWGSFGTGVLGHGGGWREARDVPGTTTAVLLAILEGQSLRGAGLHFEQHETICLLPNLLASQLSPACVPQASCRAWGLFHAVLMRQTLCFYQDRRDSLKVWWGRLGGMGGGWQQGDGSGPHGQGRQSRPTPLLLLLSLMLQSSVVALPLNLSGAVCTPDAEYTKKTNCFRLQ